MAAKEDAVRLIPEGASGKEIQEALDGLSGGGEVVLAEGIYEIRQPIVLQHDDQTLRGSGTNTILRLADKANCPVVILGAPMKAVKRVTTHLRLADLVIDGNRTNQQVELWHAATDGSLINNNGVDIWDVSDAAVEGVVCCRCRSGGLVTTEVRRLNVTNYEAFDNQFDGLACYFTEQSRFVNLNLHDNPGAGISIDLAFNWNVITNAQLTGNDLGIFMRYSKNNTFQAVTIRGSKHHGVFMAQTAVPTDQGWKLWPGTECTGNEFQDLAVRDCRGSAFLVNDSSCTNNFIRGGRFINNSGGGLMQGSAKPVIVQDLAER